MAANSGCLTRLSVRERLAWRAMKWASRLRSRRIRSCIGCASQVELRHRSGAIDFQSGESLRVCPEGDGADEALPGNYREMLRAETLDYLDRFRQAVEVEQDGSPEAGLLWMALVSSLRAVSEAGTAPWQYVLPGRRKTVPPSPEVTLHKAVQMIAADIRFMARRAKPLAKLRVDDARKCVTVPDGWATLVITSPPYANNYDYADATRLEMAFMGEIRGWGDLQETVRRHLVRACSRMFRQTR